MHDVWIKIFFILLETDLIVSLILHTIPVDSSGFDSILSYAMGFNRN